MKKSEVIANVIFQQKVLPLFYYPCAQVSIEILRALYQAGAKVIEYTNRGSCALCNFKQMVKVRDAEMPDMVMGVGTIKNMRNVNDYMLAGADFLVSPGLIRELAYYSVCKDVFYAAGCMTPAEIIAAETSGVHCVKLFPGNLLGPDFLISIKDIFPKLQFMPAGGIATRRDILESWFNAGAGALAIGNGLVSNELMKAGNYHHIESETRKILQMVATMNNTTKLS